jgi:starch phosphorylase
MYIFNRVTVVPQLPQEVAKLAEISNNLWWSWNTEFLKLFQYIDRDLWETCEKNPIKFLKNISQERIEKISNDQTFLDMYREVVNNYESYMKSKDTWYEKYHKDNQNELFAYFSAEYGLDEIIPIYSGGLGILSGDHLKSASDLGLPFVAVGLLYKNGYFRQRIDSHGQQYCEYHNIDLYNLPINPVKDNLDEDVYITIPL